MAVRMMGLLLVPLMLAAGRCAAQGVEADAKGVAAPIDPLVWRSGKPEALASSMPENRYKSQAAAVLEKIDRRQLDDKALPVSGLKIVRVKVGTPGAAAGLKGEDVIVAINGKENPAANDLPAAMFTGNDYRLTVFSQGAGSKEMIFPTDDLGVVADPWVALDRFYWRLGPRDARWDDAMLVAAVTSRENVPLALAALVHARQAGCDAHTIAVFRAMILAMADRHEEALTIGLPEVKTAPAQLKPWMQWMLGEAAIGSYHLELAPSDYGVFTDDYVDRMRQEVAFEKALPEALRVTRPPLEEAKLRQTHDYSDALETLPLQAAYQASVQNADWLSKKSMTLDVPTGHFHKLMFGPALKDFVYSSDFTIVSVDPETSTWRNVAGMLIYDYLAGAQTTNLLARVDVLSNGKVRLQHDPFPEFTTQKEWFGDKKKHTLTVGLVGQRLEISVDGTAVYDGPFEAQRNVMGCFFASGMKVELWKLEWREVVGVVKP